MEAAVPDSPKSLDLQPGSAHLRIRQHATHAADSGETEARAQALRQTLRLARKAAREGGMIGLAPEGRDVGPGLGDPPEGAGLFIALLVRAGLPVMPVGISEQAGRLRLSFGPPYEPRLPQGRRERDR